MDNIIVLYSNEIKNGNITIEDVPNKLKEKVQLKLDEEIKVGE